MNRDNWSDWTSSLKKFSTDTLKLLGDPLVDLFDGIKNKIAFHWEVSKYSNDNDMRRFIEIKEK